MTLSKLDHALALAERGYYVFRLKHHKTEEPVCKTPFANGWQTEATRDPTQIKALWGDHHYNIGIDTSRYDSPLGESTGLVVIDVDTKPGKEGELSMGALAAHGKHLPATFEVTTATGGYHLFYTQDRPLQSGADKLGKHIDVKSAGGYVVAPGSTTPNGFYHVTNDQLPAPLPHWAFDLIGDVRPKSLTRSVITDFDDPATLQRAAEYLRNAPEAIQGHARNATCYKTACHLRDLGVSLPEAQHLMLTLYNTARVHPPYSTERMDDVTTNAYKHALDAAGNAHPSADFTLMHPTLPDSADPTLRARFPLILTDTPLGSADTIPARDWLIPGILLKGIVTSLVAPGGVGKSLISLHWALSLATHKNLIGHNPTQQAASLILNNEDDNDEINRRLLAASLKHGIPPKEYQPHILLRGGATHPVTLVYRNANRQLKPSPHVQDIINLIQQRNIQFLVLDPLVELHEANENDNAEMKFVMSVIRNIAAVTNAAVLVVHHTKKPSNASSEPYAGNVDAGRGASAISNSARVNLTLMSPSLQDCKDYGIPFIDRHKYARLDDAKVNLTEKSANPRWMKRETVFLSNGDALGALVEANLTARVIRLDEVLPASIHEALVSIGTTQTTDKIPVNRLADILLMTSDYIGTPTTTLRRAIVAVCTIGLIVDGWTISYMRDEDAKTKDWIVFGENSKS